MNRHRRNQGFTLVELLVSALLMLTILGALGNLFSTSNRAYRTNSGVSERQQSSDTAGQLLRYEIGLAGYKGSTSGASSKKFETTVLGLIPISASTLTIVKGSAATAPDTITIRYYEDRYTSSVTEVITQFSVAKDRNNLYNLYRYASADKEKQPAVQGVKNLKVVKYINKDGTETTTTTADTLVALRLELTFIDVQTSKEHTKQIVVGINNVQTSPTLPTL